LPGPVVAHGRAGVGLAGGFLDVPQGHAGVDGRDKGVAERVGPDPLGDARLAGEAANAPGGSVAVKAGAVEGHEDRPGVRR